MRRTAADPLAEQLRRWRADRMAFREALSMPDGRRFGDVMAPFQRRAFEALDSGQYHNLFEERPRGASKTTDLAAEATCELFLGPPGGRLYAAAVDRDQAALLHEAAVGWIRRTPLLAGAVEIERWRIIVPATDTVLMVLAADAPSSWGLAPTWICCDELAQWPEREGEEMWLSLFTASGKRRARVVVASTPGWDRSSLCWRVREIALREPSWYVDELHEPAPWVPEDWLEEQRRSLPPQVFERLHLGPWTDAGGAFLTAAEVDAIFAPELPSGPGPAAVGVDLGVARDAAVVALVRRLAGGLIVVEALQTWEPRGSARVELQDVEQAVAALGRRVSAPVILDPWQAVLLGQRLKAQGAQVVEFPFTSENRRRLFSVLLDLVRSNRLRCRPHEALRRELVALEVQETTAGWRVDHRPGRHDDHVIAVGLAAQRIAERPAAGSWAAMADLNADLEAPARWGADAVVGRPRPRWN